MQNETIAEKASKSKFNCKEYTLPSGNIIKYQGYEKFAYDELLKEEKIDENDIITGVKNVPTIWYEFNNKKCRHFVDIYIKTQNRCIEVKSSWTITRKPEKIFAKMNKAIELGYNYEIWVFSEKGEKIAIHK
jgi:hypothetical protein